MRLAVVRRLVRGPASVAELREAVGGGRHRVPPTAVVPLLVGLLAAADVGGVLG